jgi:ketosteroid isomerase-like protein
MTNGIELVSDVLNAYKAAVYRKDIDTFAALYDDDVKVFDVWGRWECRGIESWRAMAVDWFASLGSETVVVGIEGVQGYACGEIVAGHAFLNFTAVSAEGTELRSLDNRITLVLRRTGECWKIIHEHTSAPVNSSNMKVILQREQGGAKGGPIAQADNCNSNTALKE